MSTSSRAPAPAEPSGDQLAEGAAGEPPSGERPLRADARRNRERVIEAATEAFAVEGLAVAMDDIARRAGVGVGTIYRQFPTKETLYVAIIRRGLDQVTARARALAAAEDPGSAFFDFLRELLETVAAKRELVEALASAGTDLKSMAPATEAEWHEAVGALVERAQQAGAVRPDVQVPQVLALLGGTCGAVMHAHLEGDARAQLAAVVCDGLRCPPAT